MTSGWGVLYLCKRNGEMKNEKGKMRKEKGNEKGEMKNALRDARTAWTTLSSLLTTN